jgi:hypothetical protein
MPPLASLATSAVPSPRAGLIDLEEIRRRRASWTRLIVNSWTRSDSVGHNEGRLTTASTGHGGGLVVCRSLDPLPVVVCSLVSFLVRR